MKILHIVPYFPPERIGGVGEVAAHLHRGLKERGHNSTVLTAGTTVSDPSVRRIASTPGGFVTQVARYARLGREFDVVHCHTAEAIALVLAMKLTGVPTPILATYHVGYKGIANALKPFEIEGRTIGRGWVNFKNRHFLCSFHRIIDQAMLMLIDCPSFISRRSASDILGAKKIPLADVIYNALPTRAEGLNERPEQTNEILFVGRDDLLKRLELLPFILRDVRKICPEATLRIIGINRESREDIVKIINETGQSEYVIWQGTMRSDEIRPYYRAATVLIVPSAWEGLPMVILEAFREGLPVVASRVGGIPEIIDDGVNGFLVDQDQSHQFASKITTILLNNELRRAMSQAARIKVSEQFDLKKQTESYLAVYRSLCDAGEQP